MGCKGPDVLSMPLQERPLGSADCTLCCSSLQLQCALLQVLLLCLPCKLSHTDQTLFCSVWVGHDDMKCYADTSLVGVS